MGVIFNERQPGWPRGFPLALETEVRGTHLRFRTTRRGHWKEVALPDIQAMEVARILSWSWPVGYKLGFTGEEAYFSTSGKSVRLTLKNGRKLFLGSRDPERLAEVLKLGSP